MLIDAALSPSDIALLPQRDLTSTTCVVLDVLRATSSMITGLSHGAVEIYPVKTIEEAHELKGRLPAALLAGERHGDPIAGFDLGNSPLEYRDVAGRAIISTTTNGTIALRACEKAERVLVAALLNLQAVADVILAGKPRNLLLVCGGTFADLALEDVYAAGRLMQLLATAPNAVEVTDAGEVCLAVAGRFPSGLAALQSAKNGRVLASHGRSADVDWCARESIYDTVGFMEAAVIRSRPK